MPQLDRIIVFPQIFWLFLILIIFYSFLIHVFLPKFLISLKLRKEIINYNSNLLKKKKIDFIEEEKKILSIMINNIKQVQNCFYINNSQLNNFLKKFIIVNPVILNKKCINMITNNILFCNKSILNHIKLYPSLLNFKGKS